MKLHSGIDARQLLQMLGNALHKETSNWSPRLYKQPLNKDVEISPAKRDETVRWLARLNQQFKFYPETFFLSVSLMDRFLHAVKVRPKYLQCIGIACFYLAAKTLEEDEVLPETMELVRESQCGLTVSEVLRMERCILNKLNWELLAVTPLDFLHIMHALVLSNLPHLLDSGAMRTSPSRQLSLLTACLQRCVGHHHLATIPPSALALAALSLELEQCGSDWLAATLTLQKMIEVDSQQLIRCREVISNLLGMSRGSSMGPASNSIKTGLPSSSGNKPAKRKMEEIEEEDDIYEGIKRLYNDDPCEVSVTPAKSLTTCALEVRHNSTAPLSLQAVAN